MKWGNRYYFLNPLAKLGVFLVPIWIVVNGVSLSFSLWLFLMIVFVSWLVLTVQTLEVQGKTLYIRNGIFKQYRIDYKEVILEHRRLRFFHNNLIILVELEEGFDFSALRMWLENGDQIEIFSNAEALFATLLHIYRHDIAPSSKGHDDVLDA